MQDVSCLYSFKVSLTGQEKAYEIFCKLDAFEPSEPDLGIMFETWKLRFDPEAQKLFDEWRTSLELKVRSEKMAPVLESHLAKYRFAGAKSKCVL